MKGKKFIVPLVLASLVISPITTTISSVQAAANSFTGYGNISDITNVYGDEVKVSGYKSKVNFNDTVTVPTLEVSASTTATVLVTDPMGNLLSDSDFTQSGSNKTFKANLKGIYTYSFMAEQNGVLTSVYDSMTVTVEADTYELKEVVNPYYSMPTNVVKGQDLKLTVPELYKNEDEDATDLVAADLTDQGQPMANATGIVLEVSKTSGSQVNYYAEITKDKDQTIGSYMSFKADQTGRYRVRYKYYENGTLVAISNTSYVNVNNSYNFDNVDLNFSLKSSIPSNWVLGSEVTLPNINVFDKNVSSTDYIDAYTKITVQFLGNNDHKAEQFAVTDFKFTPMYEGMYNVQYEGILTQNMVDGKALTTGVKTSAIDGTVSDTKAPSLYLVNDYTYSDDGSKVMVSGDATGYELSNDDQDVVAYLGDTLHKVDSAYQYDKDLNEGKVKIALPAAFAVDNYYDSQDVTITREFYRSGQSGDKLELINASGDKDVKINETAFVEVDKSGDYVVLYTYTDGHNQTSSKSYEITVYDKADTVLPTAAPVITMQSLSSIVEKDGKIEFNVPTASDKHDGVVYDERVNVATYYTDQEVTSTSSNLQDIIDASTKFTKTNDNNKYELSVEDFLNENNSATAIYVYTVAYNDYYANPSVEVRKVNIRGTETTNAAPEMSSTDFNTQLTDLNELTSVTIDADGWTDVNNTVAAFDQLKAVKVPSVSFTDADQYLEVTMTLSQQATDSTNSSKATFSKSFKAVTVDNNNGTFTHTLSGAEFETTYSGLYVVTYVARDASGNMTFKSFGIRVNDTIAPNVILTDTSKYDAKVEVGQFFEVPKAQLKDNGVIVDNGTITWTVDAAGKDYVSNNNGFTPNNVGDYYVTYTGVDAANNEQVSIPYTVTVVDTKAPVITLNSLNYEDKYEWADNTSSLEITIPTASAIDPSLNKTVVTTIKVTDSNGNEKTTSDVTGDNTVKTFKASSQGVYTIVYTAVDDNSLTSTKTITIEVGDVNAPELVWENEKEDRITSAKLGESWKFDFEKMLNVTDLDSDDTIENDGITYEITMVAPSGEEIDATNSTYTFSEVGNYTFKIVLKDSANNSTGTSYQYNISVTEDEKDPTVIDSVVGTVLIVVSVVILAGVVTYFVVTGVKNNKNTSKSKSKSKK